MNKLVILAIALTATACSTIATECHRLCTKLQEMDGPETEQICPALDEVE